MTHRLRPDRKRQRQLDADERQARYNRYVDDLLLNSSADVAQRKFAELSPSQQRRVISDSRFVHLDSLFEERFPQ